LNKYMTFEAEITLPESLRKYQVYGTVFHMNHGNPFKLKALVDKWPDFNTVVVRPQEQDMTDDLDHYTNTYQVYSKDPQNCQEFLGSPGVINWKQHLQIQSCQSSLNEAIQNLAATKSFKIQRSENILFIRSETLKNLTLPSLLSLHSNQDKFKFSSLDLSHAALVDKFWFFGGNERSQKFIRRCIQNFQSFCLLGPEGTPVSWTLMDHTGETRMGGTLPEYRAQGLVSNVIYMQAQAMVRLGFPVYSHTNRSNVTMQKVSQTLHHVPMPCDWNQWLCLPL
uniref:Glycine N-acyltransferase-like protein n=1 Tax=Sciurus vulgaris TaxID=55149 RepID=A0A8D2CYZ8_SCIVU